VRSVFILALLTPLLAAAPASLAARGGHERNTQRPGGASNCEPARPGDARIRGAFLQPYRRLSRQIVTDGSGTVINARAQWTDEIQGPIRRGQVVQRIVTMLRFDGSIYAADTVSFHHGSMAPAFSTEWVAGSLVWRREYADSGLRLRGQKMVAAQGSGFGAPPDSSRRLDKRFREPVFDFFGSMDGLIAAAIPHVIGDVTCIATYMPAGDTVGTLTLRVLRKESVEAGPGRLLEAIVVETTGLGGPLRLWVSKQPPFILKSEEVALRNGVPWRIYTTVMIEAQR
jgi:hypothetical protein